MLCGVNVSFIRSVPCLRSSVFGFVLLHLGSVACTHCCVCVHVAYVDECDNVDLIVSSSADAGHVPVCTGVLCMYNQPQSAAMCKQLSRAFDNTSHLATQMTAQIAHALRFLQRARGFFLRICQLC